jgi:hypothetical protein
MSMREVFLQQEIDSLRLALSMVKTQIRNAITDLQDGEDEDALDTLMSIVGEEP